eukprot:904109_1
MKENIDAIGNWLLSIPRDDVSSLTQTSEYTDFLQSFQNLELTHRKIINERGGQDLIEISENLLQRLPDDDMILRIFEFLNCHSLVKSSETCNRFRILCHQSAKQRTLKMHGSFYLESSMKMLRAKEQLLGINPTLSSVHVPLLALHRRIVVSNCGDSEFDGIYYCTGCNGNGYLFSKPRFCTNEINQMSDNHRRRRRRTGDLTSASRMRYNDDDFLLEGSSYQFLRCIISKRYSEATILWYMSKEVRSEDNEISQEYSFWAKLMAMGEVSTEISKYPSQTSILSQNGDPAWASLPTTRMLSPPTVELSD